VSDSFDAIDYRLLRAECEVSHLFFTQYFFKKRQGIPFRVNWHHLLIADIVDDIIAGGRKNVVINVSPGGTKTELVVINLIARGLALNPRARFLHLSGSDTLASLNSATARDIVTSDEFQRLWPMKIAVDASAKKRWNVEIDGQTAGGVYATAMGGQVTGFRAGHMAEGFQGAIIIDDPVKPEDAYSEVELKKANRKLLTTVKSRKANPDTPIVIIMQRVAQSDPSGFVLDGNVEGKWDHIRIPAVMTDEDKEKLAEKYSRLIEPSETIDGRYSYWPYKEPIKMLLEMESGKGVDKDGARISRHVFACQYNQDPVAIGGNIIHGKDFRRYRKEAMPKVKYRCVYSDTAQKIKKRNDYSVFGEIGLTEDGHLIILDWLRGKWESPELRKRAVAFWTKTKGREIPAFGQMRRLKVEDKSSGTDLIQTLRLPPLNIPIEEIEREKPGADKLTRVMDALPYIESGFILIPEDDEEPWVSDFLKECEAFTADDSHDFDDQVDVLCDGIMDLLASGNKLKVWAALGKNGNLK
jgi:predicted phage terminase large subunit-like protein